MPSSTRRRTRNASDDFPIENHSADRTTWRAFSLDFSAYYYYIPFIPSWNIVKSVCMHIEALFFRVPVALHFRSGYYAGGLLRFLRVTCIFYVSASLKFKCQTANSFDRCRINLTAGRQRVDNQFCSQGWRLIRESEEDRLNGQSRIIGTGELVVASRLSKC